MSLPDPLTPADCDLRAFPTMPLDAGRLFGSEFHAIATDGAWRAGVTLWLRSWHQVPAASLPDDDVQLARLAEFGREIKAWKKVRGQALHGWIKCADGRLYHPTVAEIALASWKKRQAFKERSAKGNKQRWRDHKDEPDDPKAILEGSNKDVLEGSPKESLSGPKERKGKERDSSVANATAPSGALASSPSPASDPPPDPSKVMFDAGVRLLTQGGKPEPAARRLLGKWKRDRGEAEVIEALGAAQRAGAIDPASFIEARWRSAPGKAGGGYEIGGTRMSSPC